VGCSVLYRSSNVLQNTRRHDNISEAADVARQDYDALLAVVHESVRRADHVVLIAQWLDDVQHTILSRARMSVDDSMEAKWLSLAEITMQQVTERIATVKADIDRCGGAAHARFV